jgi:GNAT superfamily N-acetyltransferase
LEKQIKIHYLDTKIFQPKDLKDLFLSVEWSSGNYPEKLVVAMQNSDKVYSAWAGDELVGLMNALSDQAMTAYFHYLLVKPAHQKFGIGRELVHRMLADYADFPRKVLIAYDNQVAFYQKCGFEIGSSKTPMFVTELTT